MELLLSLAIPLAGLAICVLSYLALPRCPRGPPFPPGPLPLPILGNYFDIPKVTPWIGYRELAKRYGDIMSFRVMGRVVVVVNSAQIARDLLKKRSAIYSSRQESVMIKLCGWEWNFGFMPYGQTWRTHRQILWQHYRREVVNKYDLVQIEGAHRLLPLLLAEPDNLSDHVRYTVGRTIASTTYGLADDKYIALSEEAMSSLNLFQFGGSLLEYLPWFAHVPTWFPGTGSLRRLAHFRRVVSDFRDIPWADAKAALNRNIGSEAPESLAGSLLAEMSHVGADEAVSKESTYKNVAGAVYGAAVETTHASICAFFVAMALYPDVQKRARTELDAVVGIHRLPDFADRDKLPYVNAIVKETMRWHTVGPLAIPHVSTADDTYNGMFIPKNAIVVANSWSILHDPKTYPEPEEFKPERFLKLTELDTDILDPEDIAFGLGRRICPGRHFATSTLFIYIASILHTLSISPAVNEDGDPIPVDLRPTDGLISHFEQCRCTIKPRSKGAEAMLKEAVAEI